MRPLAFILALCSVPAFGQWISYQAPPSGACFFTRTNFRGERFCLSSNERMERLPSTFRRKISSVRLYGNAELVVFDQANLQGQALNIAAAVSDLGRASEGYAGSRYWYRRVASIRVVENPGHAHSAVAADARPAVGACFYREPSFRGQYFCLELGRHPVPREFLHDIESITCYGDVQVIAWDHEDFTGGRIRVWSSAPDLHEFIREDERNRNWANRIASIEVRMKDPREIQQRENRQ